MKKRLQRAVLLLAILFVAFTPTLIQASTPYKTYTVDGYGYVTETQTAYSPDSAITKVGEYAFSSPSDIKITPDGKLYIADTGNKRVLVSDLEGNHIATIGEGELTSPTGLFITEDGMLYVADKDGKKVVVFDQSGAKVMEYGKPEHPLYGANNDFKPQKIAVGNSGNMYIICEGNTNGIVQLAPTDGGTFIGYFGTNFTSVSLLEMFQRMIFTDEQKARMLSNLPSTPTNLTMDSQGLIYTVTQGEGEGTLKKLNIAGDNLLDNDPYYEELPAAVAIGNYDNMFVASQEGYVYEYSSEGELLFVFGGKDDGRARIGLCDRVAAIAVDTNNKLYLLDQEKQQIHVFKPTEFTDLLHDSLYLYGRGRYTESKEPLSAVLEMNSLFDYANMAMGRAYYQEENFTEALKYSRMSKDMDGYSDSYWEIRNTWIRNNLIACFVGVMGLFAVYVALKKLQQRKGIFNPMFAKLEPIGKKTLMQQIRYAPYFMKHPVDGSYGVKREGKASYWCANLILLGVILLSIWAKYGSGFLLKTVRDGQYDLVGDVGIVILVFLVLVSCNYLMCTIHDGEGRFKELYCAYTYALTPFLFFKPISIIISNVITYNEVFLVQFLDYFTYAWIVVLLFLAIKEINNYTMKETIKNIVLTAFTVLIVALLTFILYILCSQVVEFVVKIVGEVAYRIG